MSTPIRPVLDHVVINVLNKLDDAHEIYRKLGFHLTERGHHSLGTSNHLSIFGENYLELLGFEAGNEHKRPELLAAPPGLTGLVFKTDDSSRLYDQIRSRGLPVEAPAEFFRPVTLPSGRRDAKFRTVRLGAELVRNGRTFFCHHFTPELVWRDEWRGHPNGVTDISGFIVTSADPAKTASLYEKLFGPGLVEADGWGGHRFQAGRAQVQFITPVEGERRFGAIEVTEDGTERMVALELQTRSLADLCATLSGNGVPSTDPDDGAVLVQAAQAFGVALRFVERAGR
jgi:hypothetical protein